MGTDARTLKEFLRETDAQLSWALTTTASLAVTKMLVDAGYDYIMIDLEHGSDDPALIDPCIEAIEAAGAFAGVKARSQSEEDLRIAHDFAVSAIYVPSTSSAEEVRTYIATLASLKDTEPRRGPSRDAAFIPLLETLSGVEASEEIASIPGVDALAVGPGDLSRDLGIPGDTHNPRVHAAYEHMLDAAQKTGIPVGVGWPDTSREQWAAWRERGNRFEFGMIDLLTLRNAAAAGMENLQSSGRRA